MSIDAIFKALDAGLKADPGVVKRVQGVYAFNITNTDGSKANWVVDLKNGNGAVTQGTGAADCTITIGATDFVDLMQGKLNGQQAFMGGKLKIGGNMMLAMKLSELTKSLNAGQAAAPAAAAPAAATPAAAASNSDGLSAVFAQLEQNAKADPSVSQRVNGSYKFVISGGAGGEQTWLVNLKNGQAPSIKKADGDADCTITMKEDDFMALMQGKIDGQNAFMQGKLKLKGNMALAMKLGELVKQKSKL